MAIENNWDQPAAFAALRTVQRQACITRHVDLATGRTWLTDSWRTTSFGETAEGFFHVLGPRYRALVIGATELSRYVTNILRTLGFAVTVCDPRPEYSSDWDIDDVRLTTGMPDDEVLAMHCDPRTAVLAVSHDPKLTIWRYSRRSGLRPSMSGR